MKLGISVRTMGPQSTRETLVACARAAEEAGLDEVYVPDHIAIPPDDAEGSGGRYLDPLIALTWIAAKTERIGLGTAVLILPYRPALPTAKVIATLQELSGNRLTALGVGVGWMEPEFRALGLPRARRARDADVVLELLVDAFRSDVVERNGQKFLFLPRPPRPQILIGGAAPHALARAARFGDGWMPIGAKPADLAPHAARLRELFLAAGKPAPELAVMTRLPLEEPARAADLAHAYAELGATRLVHASRYADAAEFARSAQAIASRIRA
ncbi:MAG TPA: TIGR03619 family F420-dependent LLM class oxidoreductase [Myxococcota bacterium]|nr:TIGR03619 family F420-dependent LLM class oxidoreductase [Myxococcota bacterium]